MQQYEVFEIKINAPEPKGSQVDVDLKDTFGMNALSHQEDPLVEQTFKTLEESPFLWWSK